MIPRLVQPYPESFTYLDNFRHCLRAIYAHSKSYLSRIRDIQNSALFMHVMYHAYSGIFTKLHISRHICPHWDSDIFRMVALPVQVI